MPTARELRGIMRKFSVRELAAAGILTAAAVILTRLLTVNVADGVRIGLGNLPILLAGLWLGPVYGVLVGALSDVLGAILLSPYGWNPLLTVSPALYGLAAGLIGLALKKAEPRWLRLWAASLICHAVSTMTVSTAILASMYGLPFWPLALVRAGIYIAVSAAEAALALPILKRVKKNDIRTGA